MRSQLSRARVIRHLDRERAASAGARDPLVDGELLPAAADSHELQAAGHSPERAQTDESLCPSNADLVGSNRARPRWRRISVGLLELVLARLTGAQEPSSIVGQSPAATAGDGTRVVSIGILPSPTDGYSWTGCRPGAQASN
jgi:hypothetical protein